MVQVNACWALWGKHSGTHDDYSVLASSTGSFSRADFSAILSRFAPGTPSANVAGPGALPWVTVSWVGVNDSLHLGIAIQKPTGQADGVGRSIIQTSYFCLPYGELAGAPVSYTSLYEKVAELRLPLDDGDPIPLTLPGLDQDELARSIVDFGEQTVATTAALLLRGPVSIVRADISTLPERLRFVEAVAALLPYGYRARYTAATWSDSGSRHRIRLAFAERPREGAQPVMWREAATVPADDAVVQGYLRQLGRLRGWIPSFAAAREFGLPEIIERLAKDSQPQKFEQPKPAVDGLLEIDLPFAVLDMVSNGTADRDAVRRLFSASRIAELPADGQRRVLAELINYGDRADWPAIEQAFGPIAGTEPRALLPALVTAAHGLLWKSSPGQAVRDHLALAASYGLGDEVLAGLVRPPGTAGGRQAGLTAAAALVRERVIAADATGTHPRTLEALRGHPALGCELLAQVAGSDLETARALDWLTSAMPQHIVPFNTVLTGRSHALSRHEIGHLATTGNDCVRALLDAASRVGRLDLVLPGFLLWLAHGGFRSADQRFWRDELWTLRPTNVVAAADADLALLVVNSSPRSLLVVAPHPAWPAYASRFIQAWATVTAPGRPDPDDLGARLGQYLNEQIWADDQALARAVVELTRGLTASRFMPALAAAVASSLSAEPDAAHWRFAQDWLAEVERDHPGVVREGALISLRSLRPGVRPDRVAALCVRACRDGASPAAAGTELAESGALGSQRVAATVLQEIGAAFILDGAGWEQSRAWLAEFTASFASGYPGEGPGAVGFRQVMRWIATAGILHGLDLLAVTADSGPGFPDLTDDERGNLEYARDSIDQLLKAAKRAPSRKHGRHLPGGYRSGAAG